MKRLALFVSLASVASVASATNLTGTMSVDDFWTAYLSTNDTDLGDPISSGTFWGSPSTANTPLTPGTTYFLHVVGQNTGGPSMFIAEFNLTDSGFSFSNGTQNLLTNTTDWKGNLTGFGNSYGTPQDLGADGTSPWGNFSGINDNAHFIWMDPVNTNTNQNFFSITITPNAVPEPGTLAALAFGGAVLLRRRRNRS